MRISVTTIESYRLWSDPDQDWMEESELIETIKGVFKPTPKMLVGQAFGRAIERPSSYRDFDPEQGQRYCVPVRTPEGWKEYIFPASMVDPCLARFDRRGVFEVKHTKDYDGVTVVTKADQIIGNRIVENKTKTSSFDFDKYEASYQWRFMLDIFDASSVFYNIFGINEAGDELKYIESFNLYPYEALHRNCEDLLGRFLEYVHKRELEPCLQPMAGVL